MSSSKDKIVVITGSTRGFGLATARAMLKAGATVVISGRSAEALQRALKSLEADGKVSGELADVRDEKQMHELAYKTVERFGQIDVWINNAGYSYAAGNVLEMDPKEAANMFMANDIGAMHGTQAALKYMLPRKAGMLVNIYGNGSFLRPASPTGLYGATKAWLTSFTRTLAKEIKGSGVQVLGFSPGMMLTDMLTSPLVVGEGAREMMKNYAFVLRFLAVTPQRSAEKLVQVLENNHKEFLEYRSIKPWTPFLGILRVTWENWTKTGKTPEFELEFKEAYKPDL